MLKWVTIILALLGIPLAVWAVLASTLPPPVLAPDESPPANPFPRGIAAPGAVEAASRNIRVAAPEPGLIVKVFVKVNDVVNSGDPLFQLDPRATQAELVEAEASVGISQRSLDRLRARPRPEEKARLEAALGRASARLDHRRRERERAQRIRSRGALSEQELGEADLALDEAIADRAQAQAELDLVRAGSWNHDLLVAEAELQRAQAQAQAIRQRLDRLTVRSPIAGTVLKRYLEPGEFVPAGDRPVLVVGDLAALRIRAQVDERDAHKLRADHPAVAISPGRPGQHSRLKLVQIEPLAVPKDQLTASTAELVDIRVIEVLFQLLPDDNGRPFYPGQVVDVFIDAEPAS
jgi:multidrug resistance efflux pump